MYGELNGDRQTAAFSILYARINKS